ncbi:permease [Evansella cellulosilytica]|uniref:Permease n=1 Tax=Evansella cellulosilytica (strain ATCC 21833 / DSM 2522 / FERM P-1141 / JCM 9156 / N-4) TaxID=649639 RepID=E6U0R3_EVAC2|nr:permease [Evansella cellulosilytica]ADU29111.1 permease [Evansella cellulosilytica DSM 2522]
MTDRIERYITEITGFLILALVFYFVVVNGRWTLRTVDIPESILAFNMIFLSILIEAIPFVLIGVFIAGLIQVFVTEEHIKKLIPKNKIMAVGMSCMLGALFPACECGIVPIVRKLVYKGVPIFAGVGFLLTGPLINPIVIASTYMAFGQDIKIALWRMGLGLLIAIVIAAIISLLFKENQLKKSASLLELDKSTYRFPILLRIRAMFIHSVDEFFSVGKYLIIGALLAAFVQTYVSTNSIVGAGDGIIFSTAMMMGLAYLLSLCSEADAFIGASFRHALPDTSILGFLIFGPMLDLKNTIMMLAVFKLRFVVTLMIIITLSVLSVMMLVHPWI